MTVDEVRARVAEIAALAHDDEMAHIHEDDLYLDVLSAIADGADDAQDLARAALKAHKLDFSRWCG